MCPMSAGQVDSDSSMMFSFPQGETALHIAIRKTSLDVADVLRRAPGGKELEQIRNKVGSLVLHYCSTGSVS